LKIPRDKQKLILKDITSGKTKIKNREDKMGFDEKFEERVRKVLSDPDLLKKIMED